MACTSCGGGAGDSLNVRAPFTDGVKLEYTGGSKGGITYKANGRSYRVSAVGDQRFLDVHPADVDKLLGMGVFQRVPTPTAAPQAPTFHAPAAPTPTAEAQTLVSTMGGPLVTTTTTPFIDSTDEGKAEGAKAPVVEKGADAPTAKAKKDK